MLERGFWFAKSSHRDLAAERRDDEVEVAVVATAEHDD